MTTTVSRRAVVLGFVLTAAVGFWALPLAAVYAVFLVPMSLIAYIGPSWYFGLVSLVGGGVMGVVVGGISYVLSSRQNFLALVVSASFIAAAYLGLAGYARDGWSGPGWWTPLADAVAFVAAFVGTGLLLSRNHRAHAT